MVSQVLLAEGGTYLFVLFVDLDDPIEELRLKLRLHDLFNYLFSTGRDKSILGSRRVVAWEAD